MSKTVTTKPTTTTKKTSNKRTKDPNAPKRYRTAYILFSAEKREEVKVNILVDFFSFMFLYVF